MKRFLLFAMLAIATLAVVSSCKKNDPTPPTASFSVEVTAYDSYTVNVTDNSSYDVTSRVWDWGDGTSETGYQYSHTYSRAGTYTITLKVTNTDGLSDYASKSVTITAPGGGDNPGGGGSTTTYTQVKITSIILRKFPAAPSSGSWDLLGKPDVYFKIMDGNRTTTYYTSEVMEDISNDDLPITYNINYTLYNLQQTYNISFYDRDNIDDDELMVGCVWTPSTQNDNYNWYYHWINYDSNISFTLYLSWISTKGEVVKTSAVDYENGKWHTADHEALHALGVER